MDARARGEVPFTEPNHGRRIGHGGEHDVELSEEGLRVLKHTREGGFGYIPALNEQGRITGVPASANEYVERIEAHEALFPTRLKIEGIHAECGGGFTLSQLHYAESHPSEGEVRQKLEDAGFKKTKLGSTAWFNPVTNHVVNDAKTDNFRKTARGKIVPVDLQIVKATPGSALHKALMESIGK